MESMKEESAGEWVHVHRKTLINVRDTMRHARVFITTREKMHPDGQTLYDEAILSIDAIIGK